RDPLELLLLDVGLGWLKEPRQRSELGSLGARPNLEVERPRLCRRADDRDVAARRVGLGTMREVKRDNVLIADAGRGLVVGRMRSEVLDDRLEDRAVESEGTLVVPTPGALVRHHDPARRIAVGIVGGNELDAAPHAALEPARGLVGTTKERSG